MYRSLRIGLLVFGFMLAGCGTMEPNAEVEIDDLVPGFGPEAVNGDTVTVHYVGKLTTGRIFDSSYAALNPNEVPEDRPLTFVLGSGRVVAPEVNATVIEGWIEGVPGMRVGGTRRLTVPPELGFGSRGRCENGDCVVPPNATLIFDIELLAIRPGNGAASR